MPHMCSQDKHQTSPFRKRKKKLETFRFEENAYVVNMNEQQRRLKKLAKKSHCFYKGAYYDSKKERYVKVNPNHENTRFAKRVATKKTRKDGIEYMGKTCRFKRKTTVWGWY